MPEEQGGGAGEGAAGGAGEGAAGGAQRTSVWQEQPRVPCGVQGCLFGAVALFIVLLVGMLAIVMMRFGAPF